METLRIIAVDDDAPRFQPKSGFPEEANVTICFRLGQLLIGVDPGTLPGGATDSPTRAGKTGRRRKSRAKCGLVLKQGLLPLLVPSAPSPVSAATPSRRWVHGHRYGGGFFRSAAFYCVI